MSLSSADPLPRVSTFSTAWTVEKRTGLPLAETSARCLLPKVRVPLLIVHDRRDNQVPFAEAEALAAHAPDATLLPTDGLGHGRILSAPAVIENVRNFLLPPR